MESMIENLINGNIEDAKKAAKRFKAASIREYLLEMGRPFEHAALTAGFLKSDGTTFQQYCDARV